MRKKPVEIHQMIFRPLELKEYAPAFGEQILYVWINPPDALMQELTETIIEMGLTGQFPPSKDLELFGGVLVALWWNRPDGTNSQELLKLISDIIITDVTLYIWLISKTLALLVGDLSPTAENAKHLRFISMTLGYMLAQERKKKQNG